jgi:hypothetical protein
VSFVRSWPLWLLLSASCVVARRERFQVLPGTPSYLLRSPDARETPFPELLRAYNGFERGKSWMDLRPDMELRIENAYYEKGAPRSGLKGFLGTEVAHYEIQSHGLRLKSVQSMAERPPSDLPVQQLIPKGQMHLRHYRLYFEILFARKSNAHTSALLGANSEIELLHPETVCDQSSMNCTVFPEACSVSVEMKVVVNGKPQILNWGSPLSTVVAGRSQPLEVKRLRAGRLVPVELNTRDPNALRLPLLPGDHVDWR